MEIVKIIMYMVYCDFILNYIAFQFLPFKALIVVISISSYIFELQIIFVLSTLYEFSKMMIYYFIENYINFQILVPPLVKEEVFIFFEEVLEFTQSSL